MRKGFALPLIIALMLAVGLLGVIAYLKFFQPLKPQPSKTNTQTAAKPSSQDETVNWETYTESNLNYSFQYPPASCELQRMLGDTSLALCYLPKGSDGGAKHNNGYVITLGFISQSQLSVMGITYCGAYPNDSSRCELFKMGKVTASIDWGTGGDANASAWIDHPNGGIVTFALQPVTAESKAILKQILSTFKFTK